MQLFDCLITCGERDPEWPYYYKEGTVIREVVKHNVTKKKLQNGTAHPSA